MIPSDNIGKSASHPGVFRDGHIFSILKSQEQFQSLDLSWCPPCGKVDRTEVDMRLGDLLIEAKLTESDFQRARKPTMGLYRNFREVLSYEELPHNTHVPTPTKCVGGLCNALCILRALRMRGGQR
jgi:hypothetical protein